MTERTSRRDKILLASLHHVVFDGWTKAALKAGVADAGFTADMALRAFPGGLSDLADHMADWVDRRMLDELAGLDVDAMRVRDRVAAGVKARLQVLAPHREAMPRLLAYLTLPQNAPMAARQAWRTVDAIWCAAGDDAADFKYYTKRTLLLPVYTTTVLCWLNDDSEDKAATWDYLERRIADVLKVPALQARIQKALSSLPGRFAAFRRARG
ncbi:MAG: COQ9 family protein [Proteobacteria bacterium]|nr:COQ9 family protein [Pseudomonadota bacterium]